MADINRRFSRAYMTHPPFQTGGDSDPYAHANNSNNSFNVNEYYNTNKTSMLQLPSNESLNSNATNGTNATRRRFSVKLNHSPVMENGYLFSGMAPPLPFNAHSQIQNNSNSNLSDIGSFVSADRDIYRQQNSDHDANTLNNNDAENQQLLNILSSENFDAAQFIHMKLSDATAAKIDDFALTIEDVSKRNEDYAKEQIAESITRVLAVSETITETFNVLTSLKPKINDLNDSLSQQLDEANDYLQRQTNQNNGQTSLKINRQSMMNLHNKWNSNMKKLYSEIDKAHDLLPPIPSRHIMIESRRWGELNAITCKPIRPAHIVVMNDSILIASRIRNGSNNTQSNNKKSNTKIVKNVATYCWMIDNVTVEKGSDIPELKQILDRGHKTKLNLQGNSGGSSGDGDFDTVADSTICIKTIDSNQTYLFQTDLASEFIRVFNSIKQAKSKSIAHKRESMRNSVKLTARMSSPFTNTVREKSVTDVEKRLKPQFEQTINKMDDLLTSASLELGLHRFEECLGYLSSLNKELDTISKIAVAIDIPKSSLKAKHLNKNNKDISHTAFTQQVYISYHMKAADIERLTEKLVAELLHQVAFNGCSLDSMKSLMDIFKILKREKDAAETYLESRSRQLEECVGMVRLGGGGVASNSSTIDNFNPRASLNGSRPISRSASTQSLTAINSRPSSIGGTGGILSEMDKISNETTSNNVSQNSVISELVTAYICEISLVYMGFIERVWDEWNQLFVGKGTNSDISNVRIIEWLNEYIVELKHSVSLALINHERDSEAFTKSVDMMKSIFSPLKEKELNVDYLLNL